MKNEAILIGHRTHDELRIFDSVTGRIILTASEPASDADKLLHPRLARLLDVWGAEVVDVLEGYGFEGEVQE